MLLEADRLPGQFWISRASPVVRLTPRGKSPVPARATTASGKDLPIDGHGGDVGARHEMIRPPGPRAGRPVPLSRCSIYFTSCTLMGAMLFAPSARASTGQGDANCRRSPAAGS